MKRTHVKNAPLKTEASRRKFELNRIKELAAAFIEFKKLISEIDGDKRMMKYRLAGEEYRAMSKNRHPHKIISRRKLEYQIVGRMYRQLLEDANIYAVIPSQPMFFRRIRLTREIEALLDL